MALTRENFRTLVVANPRSAGGALGRRWTDLERTISDGFGRFDVCLTTSAGDAAAITRRALAEQGYEMVVAMGGDGTISEVVDGFFTADGPVRAEAVLGVLPFGTGGDFRRTIAAPTSLPEGSRELCGRSTRRIDVGRLTYTDAQGAQRIRHFINIASFGLSGLVDQLVNAGSKRLGGRISFGVATLRATLRYSAQRARLRLDDQEPEEVTLQTVAVANGQFFGGGMRIAPQAQLDDGVFDVVTLGPLTLLELLSRMRHVYRGTHVELPGVRLQRARRLQADPLEPTEPILLDVDGETPGRLPALFEVLPAALRLKCREGA